MEVVGYQLSPQQAHLWPLARRGTAYWTWCAVALPRSVDAGRLERAIGRVVARHEILRTAFRSVAGLSTAVQVVLDGPMPVLEEVGPGELPGGPAAIDELLLRVRQAAVDLAEPPLVRSHLATLATGGKALVLGVPALCADPASMRIALSEVAHCYLRPDEDLPDGVLQYADYAAWQDELRNGDIEAAASFWGTHRPSGSPPDDAARSFDPRQHPMPLSREEWSSARRAADRAGVPLKAFMLACWQALLRLTDPPSDGATWLVVDGRAGEQLAGSVGLLERELPLDIHADHRRLDEAARATWAAVSAALRWQDHAPYPGAGSVSFRFEDWAERRQADDFAIVRLDGYTGPFRLELRVRDHGETGTVALHYDAAQITPDQAQTLAERLRSVLGAGSSLPSTPLADLELCTPAERRQLVVDRNLTRSAYPEQRCVHQLLEDTVRRAPQATALILAGSQGSDVLRLSYQELDERATGLADALSAHGVGRGTRVGICLGRSLDRVVAVLATWKAGGAYVAVNPDDPAARVAATLDSAGCGVAVADERHADLAGAGGRVVVRLDRIPPRGAGPGRSLAAVAPDDVAYVAHTSGSTGRPLGVVVPHRGVVNYLTYLARTYELTDADVCLQLAPFTFDAWVRDCIGPLLVGAAVVLADGVEARSADDVLDRIERYEINRVLHVVPTLLRDLAKAAARRGRRVASVRTILSSGEPLHRSDCEAAAVAFGSGVSGSGVSGSGVSIVNQYGPTECTMTSTYHRVAPASPAAPTVPIGQPIANARVHLLNQGLRPVPVGATGEVFIGGPGLAYGYLGQPALTAQRFVPDPFAAEPGARLYRTGDLARYRSDGHLEFLGRRDHQVKIRGIRVEPGEVEALLAQHPSVREAAVVSYDVSRSGDETGGGDDGEAGELRLVAYVAAAEPAITELRGWLAERLPDHLVPGSFVAVDELPRTAHGKVDRRRLAAEAVRAVAPAPVGTPTEPPRSALEQTVADAFARLLGADRVGVHDSFFALGGHSLLATQLIYELSEKLGAKLPLGILFECPTVAELSERIRVEVADHGDTATRIERLAGLPPGQADAGAAIPTEPGTDRIVRQPDSEAGYPLSSAQRRLWLLEALRPGDTSHNVQMAVRITGPLDVDLLRGVLDRLVKRHEMLRTTFTTLDDEPVQVIRDPQPVGLPLLELGAWATEGERDQRLRQVIRDHARTAFDLAGGPLLRVGLVRAGDGEHVLLATMHHIVIDEWSVTTLLRDLVEAYGALAAGREPELPALPIRYLDFAAWQRRWLDGDRLAALARYWQAQLESASFELPLPFDRPRPAVPTSQGDRLTVAMPRELTDALADVGRARGGTLFMTLLAAFKLLLFHHSGQDDIVVGSPIASRTRQEVEGVVGFFANILLLRTRLDPGSRFSELLDQVRDMALGAYAHQDMPFEKLVEILRPERALHRMPLVQNWFVLHNAPLPALRTAGLELSLLGNNRDTAQFDLNLALTETGTSIDAAIEYSTDLFHQSTARRLLGHYRTLLERIASAPDVPLSRLRQELEAFDRRERRMASEDRQRTSRKAFGAVKSSRVEPVRVSEDALVTTGRLRPDARLPALFQPGGSHVDLAAWLAANRGAVVEELRRAGAILFRGFGVDTVDGFGQVVRSYSPSMLDYYERSTPRREVGGKVYSSTEYPPDRHIPLHPESAYSHYWPRTLWFCCLQPAVEGGATPLADNREILRLLGPELRQRFIDRKIMYVRNYHEGFDIPWQVAFQTDDKEVVADYCRRAGMEYEWRGDEVLRTRHVLDAVVAHPDTGELVWFNQVHASHVATLDPSTRRDLRAMFTDDELPRNVYYGDGSEITEEEFEAVREAHARATVSFPWQRGDLLLIDNMLAAHGREPYAGPRRVVVAMTDPCDRDSLNRRGP